MRRIDLFFIITIVFIFGQAIQGFCQGNGYYQKVVAIDISKQDSLQKLVLLYHVKADIEHVNSVKDSGYAFVLIKIANYENDLHNDAAKAITFTSQAMEVLQSSHQASTLLANVYFNLGILYYNIRIYDKAKVFFDKTTELCADKQLREFYFTARVYGAAIDDLLGDYEKVKTESTLAMAEAKADNDSTSYIGLLYMHCRAMMFQNQLQAALAEAAELEAWTKRAGNNFYLANAYNLRANVYKLLKNYKAAETFFKLAMKTRLSQSDDESAANDCNELASVYVFGLQDYKQALIYYAKSIYYGEKCPAERRSGVFLNTYGNLGNLHLKTKEFKKAIACYSKALEAVSIRLTDFLSQNPSLRQLSAISEKSGVLTILSSKCELLLDLYRNTNQAFYLQYCINTAITADSLIVQMRHEQTGDKSRLFWRDKTHEFFSEAMEACYLSGNVEKAFFLMEKSRSVLLNDKLNELSSTSSYLPPQLALAENRMITDIRQKQKQLAFFTAGSPEYTNGLRSLDKQQNDFDKFIHSIEKEYPLYYQYKYADDVPALSYARKYLADNKQSLVYYFTGDSALYMLGITKEQTRFVKVPAKDFDTRQLSRFNALCSSRRECNSNYNTYASIANNIYRKLFAPLYLPSGSVVICSDNFFIPFDALCSDVEGKQFLVYRYNFSYTYSARSLMKPFKSSVKAKGDFIGFAPVSFSKNLNVFPLQKSASALQKIAGSYRNKIVFTSGDATRSRFFSDASKYAVLTIFSHAQADTTDKEPVLYMHDSLIHLSELQMLDNPATQFVMLSACQTNTGKSANGEGIYSLARGFAAAGVPAVSATLWKADEEAVYAISAKFNDYLSEGMNKSEALQKAKLWYLQNSNHEHALPYYWANLVLTGSSNSVSFSTSNFIWIWIVIAASVLLLFLVLLIRNHKKRKMHYASCPTNEEQ